MFHETNIENIRPGLTPFPENIFVEDQPWIAEHLLPLLSIDLGILRPELAGTVVHMLCPLTSSLGRDTEQSHNEFASLNWFSLQLTEDNRYRFLGNEGYFIIDEESEALRNRQSYAKSLAYFKEHGRLGYYYSTRSGETGSQENEWLSSLGGEIDEDNWAGTAPPDAFDMDMGWENNRGLEITYQGNKFFAVAAVPACYYGGMSGAYPILMFYEPKSRIVLFAFNWD